MNSESSKPDSAKNWRLHTHDLYSFLASRPYSVFILGALFCTLAVKFFNAWRSGLTDKYFSWILTDIAFLLGAEVLLVLVCFFRPRKLVLRTATFLAFIIYTWSVMNAGWLLRTGTQILPRVLLPLFRAPLNALHIVGVNLIKMPKTAVILLGPGTIAIAFLFAVLIKPRPPVYRKGRLLMKVVLSIVIVACSLLARSLLSGHGSPQLSSLGLQYNCHMQAVASVFVSDYRRPMEPQWHMPAFDQFQVARYPQQMDRNVVLIILEGVQYRYTSFANKRSNLTPYLNTLSEQGMVFSNARSSLSHTTKALFALLTGRFPSASQDIAEAVPAVKPYVSVATILRRESNYRTAFFQSALGNFESRPGLVYNLGFDKFWARDDLNDPNSYLGYLACDEFSMLKTITEWLESDDRPFFLTILCSVTHDPYEVPEWFETPAKEPLDRYKQSIRYTDKFVAALDVELARRNLTDKTVFCVIGDHGEAFGEHGQLGHALIAFDEVLRIPFCLRAPFLIEPGVRVSEPVSSVDLTPTLLGLLGFKIDGIGFDGVDVVDYIPEGRKVFFSGWMREGPAGFVQGDRKYIYRPTDKTAYYYDVGTDPRELMRMDMSEQEAQSVADEIIAWRKSTVFRVDQQRTGKKTLFGQWLCRWTNRVCSAKYQNEEE
ncbi:MAG: sulfatase-like hydrolase/transferase [Phycisphaerales bacterium]|jgi:arylsulfatase A-like enzyme